ncbi:MAG: ATP-binding cassette domain-containing protein [Ancalomicrobiaceae bacterium]|nr:ATP-binding cassette domain-containing protein [Ancalomicrobiaceae bacterium]
MTMLTPDTTSHTTKQPASIVQGPRADGQSPVLRCRKITKRFGGLVAVDQVDFDVYPGETVALLGDNGAGKSTLIQMIAGVYRPDGGVIELDDQAVDIRSPLHARDLGIETVFQDLALCDNLGASENIFLGREIPGKAYGMLPGLNEAKMRAEAKAVLSELHINIRNLDAPVRTLSGGQRQATAIARAVYWKARLMIMDEPTAALGVPEQKKVLSLIETLKQRGVPVIVISHNMQDVFEVADRLFIMRRGRAVADLRAADTDANEVVRLMVG